MVDTQKTLIYVNEENLEEAKFMSRNFVNSGIKKRAYLNTLGAEIVKDYLASEGVDVVNLHNLHSISKILEKNDIADILLPNIHIDVRVVFNEEQIFVPKSHFEKEMLPDVYVAIKFDEEFKTAEFLGYFQPSIIDKSKGNKEYYFLTRKQLISPQSFVKCVKDFTGKAARYLTEEDMLRGRELSVALNDHDLSVIEEQELIELLMLSDPLRESVLEFDNFETLAHAASGEVIKSYEESGVGVAPAALPTVEELTESDIVEEPEGELAEDIEISEDAEESIEEDVASEDLESEEVTEDLKEPDLLGDDMLDEPVAVDETEPEEAIEPEEIDEIVEAPKIPDTPQVVHSVAVPQPSDEISVDDILDKTIAAIDEKKDDSGDDKISVDGTASGLGKAAITAAGITVAGAGLTAAGAAAAETAAAAEGLAQTGVIINGVAKAVNTGVNADGSTSVSIDEDFDIAHDMDSIDKVDSIASELNTQKFEQETVDMQEMDVVKSDLYKEDDADTLSDINSMEATGDTRNEDEFIQLHGISESEVVDLPMTDYVIGEDGSSPLDQYAAPETTDSTELLEMPPLEDETKAEDESEDVLSISDEESDTPSEDETPKHEEDSEDTEIVEDTVLEEDLSEELVKGEEETLSEPDEIEDTLPELDEISEEDTLPALDEVTEGVLDTLPALDEISEDLPDALPEVSEDLLDTLSASEEAVGELTETDAVEEVLEETVEETAEETVEEAAAEKVEETAEADVEGTAEEETSETTAEAPSEEYDEFNVEEFEDLFVEESGTGEQPSEDTDAPITEAAEEIANMMDSEIASELEQEGALPKDNAEDVIFADTDEEIVEDGEVSGEEIAHGSGAMEVEGMADGLAMPETDAADGLEMPETAEVGGLEMPEVAAVGGLEMPDTDMVGGLEMPGSAPIKKPHAEINYGNEDAQDLSDDSGFINMEDIGRKVKEQTVISEPQKQPEPEVVAQENSRPISSTAMSVGEIPIDINNSGEAAVDNSPLGNLYNPDSQIPGQAIMNNPGTMSRPGGKTGGAPAIIGIFGAVIVLVIVTVIGFFAYKMLNAPKETSPQPITDDNTTSYDNGVNNQNTLSVNKENVLNIGNNSNALASTASATEARKTGKAIPFVDVKKLTWEVPDYISYNEKFKAYFQSVGKTLKLALVSDLLLAKDYIYSPVVKVSVTFAKDGTFRSSQILSSSGSTQIDSIVLQTVNQTLKGLKAPHSLRNDESTTAILKIYF